MLLLKTPNEWIKTYFSPLSQNVLCLLDSQNEAQKESKEIK